MKKLALLFLMILGMAAGACAQTPASVFDKAVGALKKAGTVSAKYSLHAGKTVNNGSIVLSGSKFRLMSNVVKCWYDGKTQWSYSPATGEVSVTTPSGADLQLTNPHAAAQSYKNTFNMWKAYTQIPGCYTIKMMPKKKSQVRQILVYVTNGTYLISKVKCEMTNGTSYTIKISDYKTKASYPASTFKFDPKLVPAGTEVVDLR